MDIIKLEGEWCPFCGCNDLNYDLDTGNKYCKNCDDWYIAVNGVKNE